MDRLIDDEGIVYDRALVPVGHVDPDSGITVYDEDDEDS